MVNVFSTAYRNKNYFYDKTKDLSLELSITERLTEQQII